MTEQKPAQGILLQKNYGDMILYKVCCDCGNPEDDLTVSVEADDFGITVHHYVKVKTNWWSDPTKFGFVNSLWHRLKVTYNVWVNGYVEYETYTVLDQQQALNYASALTQGIDDVKRFREQYK